ncbi:hypothetical protein, partial [Streptomyces mesophilus]
MSLSEVFGGVDAEQGQATGEHRPGGFGEREPGAWSSCAVAMNSCVWASTPTVTRMRTGWRLPSRWAM